MNFHIFIYIGIGAERLSNQDYFEYYLWNIQNKYYKTQVLVCVTENPSPDISINGVEALIVHHNTQAVRFFIHTKNLEWDK